MRFAQKSPLYACFTLQPRFSPKRSFKRTNFIPYLQHNFSLRIILFLVVPSDRKHSLYWCYIIHLYISHFQIKFDWHDTINTVYMILKRDTWLYYKFFQKSSFYNENSKNSKWLDAPRDTERVTGFRQKKAR